MKKLAVIKTDFINNITHELKTPVTTISAALEALNNSELNKKNIFAIYTFSDLQARLTAAKSP